ncbi:MAG: HEAT repeat protein [Hyphomicrobiaceae bacterium]|jgi:HEAT repeat protein
MVADPPPSTAMNRSLALTAVLLPTIFAACSTGNSLRQEQAPDLVERQEDIKAKDARQKDFQVILIRLDQAIDEYVTALANQGDTRADDQAEKLFNHLRRIVLDEGPRGRNPKSNGTRGKGYIFAQLRALALDGTYPDRQAIALSALGFSGRTDVMNDILQGARLDDPYVVDHAVLGLAILRSRDTPPNVLAAIAENPKHPEDGRVQAAWALYRVQTSCSDQSEIAKIWARHLGAMRKELPPGIIVTAIRGLGLTTKPEYADLVVPMLKDPTPRIRMSAALALGRMNAQDHWQELLSLLKPQESVQNVRLSARKALARLAGNQDYGYDVSAWQKVFERDLQKLPQ